ncbi:hypothetical protein R6Q59_030992 [Mikania micrantha]|uniref:Uncharacterized protein n=1 Tax=Mikania micrantha TaxID=192012 RepID=A0A5N6NXL4_9ASTR|nr:hypothetical protein E3N88_16134 [Mikania micrantha]
MRNGVDDDNRGEQYPCQHGITLRDLQRTVSSRGEARETQYKHIYHSDCIMSWLTMRNSYPLYHHELPTYSIESRSTNLQRSETNEDESSLVYYLYGAYQVVVSPSAGSSATEEPAARREREKELSVVYTESDDGSNDSSGQGRILQRFITLWTKTETRKGQYGHNQFFKRVKS